MKAAIENISAITLKVARMETSVHFYRDVLGLELLYGGPNAGFSSLQRDNPDTIAWNALEGLVAVIAGVFAASISLIAFRIPGHT